MATGTQTILFLGTVVIVGAALAVLIRANRGRWEAEEAERQLVADMRALEAIADLIRAQVGSRVAETFENLSLALSSTTSVFAALAEALNEFGDDWPPDDQAAGEVS